VLRRSARDLIVLAAAIRELGSLAAARRVGRRADQLLRADRVRWRREEREHQGREANGAKETDEEGIQHGVLHGEQRSDISKEEKRGSATARFDQRSFRNRGEPGVNESQRKSQGSEVGRIRCRRRRDRCSEHFGRGVEGATRVVDLDRAEFRVQRDERRRERDRRVGDGRDEPRHGVGEQWLQYRRIRDRDREPRVERCQYARLDTERRVGAPGEEERNQKQREGASARGDRRSH